MIDLLSEKDTHRVHDDAWDKAVGQFLFTLSGQCAECVAKGWKHSAEHFCWDEVNWSEFTHNIEKC